MRRIAGFLVLVACMILSADALYARKDKVVSKIIEMGISDNQTMEHLDVLCNRIGGRPVGSDALETAERWAASRLREWGLDEVIVQEVGQLPVGFNRGPWFGKMIGGNGMTLHFATPTYSVGTKGVQRGHVVMEPCTMREFNKMKKQLNGAWVLIRGNSTGYPIDWTDGSDDIRAEVLARNTEIQKKNDQITAYNKEMRNKYGRAEGMKMAKELLPYEDYPALLYKEMVEAGILGIIQSAELPITALHDKKNLEKLTFDNLPPVPDIKLDYEQYAAVRNMVQRGEYFQLEFDIRNHFRMGPVKYHNIIGIIRGTEYPDEYVIAGGHLDSFDVATGGVDCGSGATPVMEAARMIVKAGGRPKRSIMFCLWTAEEFGIWGSQHFVLNRYVPHDKISNYFNRDSGPLVPTGITVPEAMYDDFVKVCEPLKDAHPDFTFTVTKRTTPPPARPVKPRGSDHIYFSMNSIPALRFTLTDPKGYNFTYKDVWHTERDTYDKSIPEYQKHSATCTAVVLYGLANLDHLLSREGLFKD